MTFFQAAKDFDCVQQLVDVGHTLDKVLVLAKDVNFGEVKCLFKGVRPILPDFR